MRATLTRALGSGDHERAMKVKEECEKGFDGIEIYSAMYISSEAFMGLNLWPFEDGTSEYALNLTENVFEFIKEEDMDKPNPKTYFVDEVEVGQKYEVVLSQKYGLSLSTWGPRKGHGILPKQPENFIPLPVRNAFCAALRLGEKVDQHVIHDSLSAALNPWKDQVEMKHYTCAENVLVPEQKDSQKPGLYYVFFLELKSNFGDELPDDLNTEILAEVIQKNLYERHEFYRVFNNTKQITTPTVYLTKEGAFTELKEYILANSSASRAQFKMPLKLRTREMAEFLLEHSLP
ncbi:putative indole-3-acetic acid-amido synthetase GH3.9 [Apostichopus japonicus]|uniref:Putative indole-3-acetic acid-amido synthetase GH3.9 n=1 Tax=Stichopus japonicus TaxID=307972 RepID=A0A2G8L9D5_STIJA|nr:putative indole-3-acetic acid-amido synthetase GH3.9 [Apostichopus japonicus]